MTRRLIAALIVAAALPARATDFGRAAVGTAGSEFLLMDTSARGIAMGGAMTTLANDASAIYWNPAGLSSIPRLSATFLHSRYVADISYSVLAVAQRINDASVIGAGVRYLDGGGIDRTDINGLNAGTFNPRSYVAELGWGQAIYDLSDSEMDLAMGVTAKAIRTDLGAGIANGYAGDLGVLSRFYTSAQSYDVGVAFQNMGVGQRFDKVRDNMPARMRFGGAFHPIKPVSLSAEVIAPINDAPHGAIGAEYATELDRTIKAAVRTGFNTLTYDSLGVVSCFSFGLGLSVSDLSFDYAFVPMGVLGGQTHRVSLSFNLPAKISRRYRER